MRAAGSVRAVRPVRGGGRPVEPLGRETAGGIPGGGMFHVKHLFHALAKEEPQVKPTDACRAETTAATQAAAPRVRGGKPRGPRIGGEPWGPQAA